MVYKTKEDITKLERSIDELEHLDVEDELDKHEKLSTWAEQNNAILALKKELSTLEPALVRADKSVEKAQKDSENLDQAHVIHVDKHYMTRKKKSLQSKRTKNLKMQ